MANRPAFLMKPAVDRLGHHLGATNPEFATPADIGAACCNDLDLKCLRRLGAKSKKAKVIRSGWPDFLVVADGKTYGIEVKSDHDVLSRTQRRTFEILESVGIPIYVWRPSRPEKLLRWRADKPGIYAPGPEPDIADALK